MRKLGPRVLENVRQKGLEQIGSPAWLNDNDSFDHGRRLAPQGRKHADALLCAILAPNRARIRDRARKLLDLEILCANLLANRRRKPLAITLNRNDYAPSRYSRAGYFTIEAVKLLAQEGWIEIKKGHHTEKEARMSRIWPTKKLLKHFAPMPFLDLVDFEPVELVNLRDSKGAPLPYQDTAETNHIRNVLRQANIVNRQALIQLKTRKGFERLSTDLHAVSNEAFDQGGRLYTSNRDYQASGYQSLTKEERPHIWINRQPTVELDFAGMQPRLLYALEGIEYRRDPYQVVMRAPELRPFLKKVMLALINAADRETAVAAGNYELHLDHGLYRAVSQAQTKTTDVIACFERIHSRIAHHFFQGIGLKLMRLDARIALEVIESFTGRGVPILAIHDSFIVQRHQKEELREVMQAAYHKHTGGFYCPIK